MDEVTLHRSESSFSGHDGLSLYWRSIRPKHPRAVLGFLHGYGDHSGRYLAAFDELARRGYAVQAYDARGHGRSEGRRGFVRRWEEYVADLDVFLGMLAKASRELPLFLMAQSHGNLVLATRGEREPLPGRGVVMCSPFFRMSLRVPAWKIALARIANRVRPSLQLPSGIRRDQLTVTEVEEPEGEGALSHRISTPRWFFTMQEAQRVVLANAGRFRNPLLVLHGDADGVAAVSGAVDFVNGAGSPDTELRRFPKGRHDLLRDERWQTTLAEIDAWMRERA